MVHEANVKRAASEKQLKEAQGKVPEAFLGKFHFLLPLIHVFFYAPPPWLPDRCPASRSDGAQDSGVDLDALFSEPPASPSAAAFGQQGRLQAPQPQQEPEQRAAIPALLGFHPARVQRGARGELTLVPTVELVLVFFFLPAVSFLPVLTSP